MTTFIHETVQERLDQQPSQAAQEELRVLREAVAQALERKRRLGQYAVVWEGGEVRTLSSDVLPVRPVVIDSFATATARYTVAEPTAPMTVQERLAGENVARAPSGTGRLG
jgi:hypothetical protein